MAKINLTSYEIEDFIYEQSSWEYIEFLNVSCGGDREKNVKIIRHLLASGEGRNHIINYLRLFDETYDTETMKTAQDLIRKVGML